MESNKESTNHSLYEDIKWYTPMLWQNGSLKLPAVFLNKYKVLASIIGKNIEFKEKYQYSIDFDAFKIDEKNIDDLFSEYSDKLPPDTEMFKYCRFLYPDSKPLYLETGNTKKNMQTTPVT